MEREGFFYYSIVRADGFNVQEHAKRRAERLQNAAANADKKSMEYYNKGQKDHEFLSLGEPIKVGHHSERRHRKIIEQAQNNASKSVEFSNIADKYNERSEYWELRANIINESMPESVEYFEYKLEQARAHHEGLKNNTIKRDHSMSLQYAKKHVNEIEKKLALAKRLWE